MLRVGMQIRRCASSQDAECPAAVPARSVGTSQQLCIMVNNGIIDSNRAEGDQMGYLWKHGFFPGD